MGNFLPSLQPWWTPGNPRTKSMHLTPKRLKNTSSAGTSMLRQYLLGRSPLGGKQQSSNSFRSRGSLEPSDEYYIYSVQLQLPHLIDLHQLIYI